MNTTVGIARFKEDDGNEKTSFASDREARQYLQLHFMGLNSGELANFTTRCKDTATARGLTYTELDIKQHKDFNQGIPPLVPESDEVGRWFITIEAE